jgi:hypothetical protein
MKYASVLTLMLLFSVAQMFAQRPCTQEEASRTVGNWGKNPDDFAMADHTFPRSQYPLVLKKADQVIALLKQAVPRLTGVEAKPYRSIRGEPYVANGPVPFAVYVPIFDYYCIPVTSGDPALRGKIEASGETGTWIYFYFNSVGWLANELMGRGHTLNGARIYVMPRQDGQLQGYPLLLPELNVARPDEAVIITPDGRLPYKALSREKYLLAQLKQYQDEADKLQKLIPVPASALTQRQNELAAISTLLNSMSDADRQSQAIVRLPFNPRGKVFASEAEGGKPLVTIDAALFKPTSSRTAIRIITVYWRTDRSSVAKSAAIRQFKDNFNFQALRQMLDQ